LVYDAMKTCFIANADDPVDLGVLLPRK